MVLGNSNKHAKALQEALQGTDENAIVQAWEQFSNAIVEKIQADYMEAQGDKGILASRGYRQLTNAETKYYNALIEASKAKNYNQAVTTLADLTENELMPETIVDAVYKDLVENYPLLSKVHFQNARYSTKVIMNDHSKQMAQWGEIEGEIAKEIVSAFKIMDIQQNKLSAYAVIPMGLLDMGATFLDSYIRTILRDAIAVALEEAIVNGDGNGKPVGLMKKLTGAVDGVHQDKDAQAITNFGVKTMGTLIAQMAKNEKDQKRTVGKLTLIVNANDYYILVAPAVRTQNFAGAYVDNFAFPMEVVISEAVPEGRAILAMLDNYFAGIGFAKEGVIEFSDHAQFLEDKRVYKIKTYGCGRALDENSALLLDISGLEEAHINVKHVE